MASYMAQWIQHTPVWWEERLNPYKLSSDLQLWVMFHVHTYTCTNVIKKKI